MRHVSHLQQCVLSRNKLLEANADPCLGYLDDRTRLQQQALQEGFLRKAEAHLSTIREARAFAVGHGVTHEDAQRSVWTMGEKLFRKLPRSDLDVLSQHLESLLAAAI